MQAEGRQRDEKGAGSRHSERMRMQGCGLYPGGGGIWKGLLLPPQRGARCPPQVLPAQNSQNKAGWFLEVCSSNPLTGKTNRRDLRWGWKENTSPSPRGRRACPRPFICCSLCPLGRSNQRPSTSPSGAVSHRHPKAPPHALTRGQEAMSSQK